MEKEYFKMFKIKIKLAETKKDLEKIASVYRQDIKEINSMDMRCKVPTLQEAKMIVEKNFMKGYTYFLALQKNKPKGYAQGDMAGNEYFIKMVFVLPKERNKGIGTMLEKEQIDYAKKNGCSLIYTYVLEDNAESLRIHQKLGFEYKKQGNGYDLRINFKGD